MHCDLSLECLLDLAVLLYALLLHDDLVHVLVEPRVGEHGEAGISVVFSCTPGVLDPPLCRVRRGVGLVGSDQDHGVRHETLPVAKPHLLVLGRGDPIELFVAVRGVKQVAEEKRD